MGSPSHIRSNKKSESTVKIGRNSLQTAQFWDLFLDLTCTTHHVPDVPSPRRLEWTLKIICGLIKMGTMTATSLVYLVLCCYLSVFVVPIPLQMQVRTTSVATGHPLS